MKLDGFDWDDGNWPKCAKHGLSKQDIEDVFSGPVTVFDDPFDEYAEERYRAIGRNREGRFVFVVFCLRRTMETQLIRPISARFMHKKEVQQYERER